MDMRAAPAALAQVALAAPDFTTHVVREMETRVSLAAVVVAQAGMAREAYLYLQWDPAVVVVELGVQAVVAQALQAARVAVLFLSLQVH